MSETGNLDGERLLAATAESDLATVNACLEAGVPTDTKDECGKTPLHLASQNGTVSVAKLLLSHTEVGSVTVDAKDKEGNSPLILASNNGHPGTVKSLLDHKADPNLQNKAGNTALICATMRGHETCTKYLLEENADTDKKNNDGNTALISACMKGHDKTARLLLQYNADIYTKNKRGYTPLILASYNGHKDTTKLLLDNGANPDEQNEDGDTALIVACRKGHGETVKLLLRANADINIKNKKGQTALDVSHGGVQRIIDTHVEDLEKRDHHIDTNYRHIHFYGKARQAAVTSEGQTVAFDDVGLIMTVPPGAVPEGIKLELIVRSCVSGPFSLPEGYQPVSPVYLIDASSQFTQEVMVSLEHFAELQHEEDCKSLVFLRASSTYSNHQYKFEEIPREKYAFTIGSRRGEVTLKHFSLLQIARSLIKGENLYSLRLYKSPNPSPEEVTAVLCITLMHQLYIQNLETEVRNFFPEGHKVTVVEPVHLRDEKVVVDVPSQIKGWSVEYDRSAEVTRSQMDLPLSNPDYTNFSSYPPKFHLRILPSGEELNQMQATSCYISVKGLEEVARISLFLPRKLAMPSPTSEVCTLDIITDEQDPGIDVPLAENDLPLLLDHLKDAAAKWREVGVYLGFRSGVLDVVERKPLLIPDGCAAFFRELLIQWLKWAPPEHRDPTVSNLVSAVRRAGEERMALKLEAACERTAKTRVQREFHSQVQELEVKIKNLNSTIRETLGREDAATAELRDKDAQIVELESTIRMLQQRSQRCCTII